MSNKTAKNSHPEFLSSVQVAEMLGVNVSTVKRWTDENKLGCAKTAGGHRKFTLSHVLDFVRRKEVQLPTLQSEEDVRLGYHIVREELDPLRAAVIESALSGSRDNVQRVLYAMHFANFPLHRIYDEVITPVLHELGLRWQRGDSSVIDTHISTQTIRDSIIRLQGLVPAVRRKSGRSLLLNLSTELHDLALKMVDHLLDQRGFENLFSGQITPLFGIESAFERFRPDRVYISTTVVQQPAEDEKELTAISELARRYNSKIYIGGQGLDRLDLTRFPQMKRLHTFEEVTRL